MAYPIIKSAWDNFSESYMKAREARAREEREKEMSLRAFDVNQRAWNEEQRSADKYINYEKQSNAYGLDDKRMANELGAADQQGLVDWAKFNSRVTSGFTTPENVTQEIARQNYNAKLKHDFTAAKAGLPPSVISDAARASLWTGANIGQQAATDYNRYNDPRSVKIRGNVLDTQVSQSDAVLQEVRDTTNAANTARANAARPSSTLSDRYTPSTNGSTFGAPAMPAATTAPQAQATATAVKPTAPVAQSPMAAMTAKQPTADVRKQPTVGDAYDFAKTNRQSIEQRLSLIGLAERAKNPVAYQALINSLNQAKINEAMAQNAWLNSPEAISAQRVFGR
jgi:hypothetical protein